MTRQMTASVSSSPQHSALVHTAALLCSPASYAAIGKKVRLHWPVGALVQRGGGGDGDVRGTVPSALRSSDSLLGQQVVSLLQTVRPPPRSVRWQGGGERRQRSQRRRRTLRSRRTPLNRLRRRVNRRITPRTSLHGRAVLRGRAVSRDRRTAIGALRRWMAGH